MSYDPKWDGQTGTLSLVPGANNNVDITQSAIYRTGTVGGGFNITGLDVRYDITNNPTPQRAPLWIVNNSGQTLTLKHLNVGSTAQNQIIGIAAADTTVTNGQTATLIYDSVDSVWRVTAVN